jgi:hypothetical protein
MTQDDRQTMFLGIGISDDTQFGKALIGQIAPEVLGNGIGKYDGFQNNLFLMVTRFFASNPIFYKIRDGRPKSEDRCTGHFSLLVRIILNYHFTGIIAYIFCFSNNLKYKAKVRKNPA